jgi:hypothetical protein
MQAVAIRVQSGSVFIEQDNGDEHPDCIEVHPEQVPLLVSWLQEAKEESEAMLTPKA